MNRTIRITSVLTLILVLILLVNLTVIQGFRQDKYANNSMNSRNLIELRTTARGQISTGGLVLAQSTEDENGYYNREYPTDGTIYGTITGYFSDIYGTSGLESSYNDVLDGSDPNTNNLSVWQEIMGETAAPGNVELTVLPSVQEVAYNQLANAGYDGAVAAIRPSTGEILALASTPSYDPSLLANRDTAESAWADYTTEEGNPLLNHATQETLPPGSTFKVLTTAAALNAGYTPQSTLTGEAEIVLPDTTTTLENYGGHICGGSLSVTLLTAFQYSCNTAFVQMGIDTGAEELRHVADAFGVGSDYDLGIPNARGTIGEIPDDSALGQSAIGQRDVSLTVLENAVIAATVANDGKRMQPYLVSRVLSNDLNAISETQPVEVTQAVSPEVAQTLTELMQASERNTSGYTGADIASKTGTAEHGDGITETNPHTWYIAFGPTAEADVAVAVVVKNGGNRGQDATGGSVAAPIGRAVIAAAEQALATQE
ncbi:MAG: penicillin-binding transpeptidase domain-containing protein [Corynebacterium sp.]|nr:penicillin-binding transpeptidase domain-containing protein [Corynebacterium sp.]